MSDYDLNILLVKTAEAFRRACSGGVRSMSGHRGARRLGSAQQDVTAMLRFPQMAAMYEQI